MIRLLLISTLLYFSAPAHAKEKAPPPIESYSIEYDVNGEPLTVMVNILPEDASRNISNELNNPLFNSILVVEEENDSASSSVGGTEADRKPAQDENEFEEAKSEAEKSGKPVEKIKIKRSITQRLDNLGIALNERKPSRKAVQTAIVSAVFRGATNFTYMIASHEVSLKAALLSAGVLAATAFVSGTFLDIRNYLLQKRFLRPGEVGLAPEVLLRRVPLIILENELIKWLALAEMAFTGNAQIATIGTSLFGGAGETYVKAQAGRSLTLNQKVFFNIAEGAVFGILAGINNWVSHGWIVHGFSIPYTTPVLIGAYAVLGIKMRQHPEKIGRILDFMESVPGKLKIAIGKAPKLIVSGFRYTMNEISEFIHPIFCEPFWKRIKKEKKQGDQGNAPEDPS